MKRQLLGVMLSLLVASCLAAADAASRPALIRKQGRYFSWAVPNGWRDSESTNGVDLNSPDGKRNAAFCMLLRNPGQSTPEQFAYRIAQLLQVRDFRISQVNRITGQPNGIVTAEMEFTYTDTRVGARCGSTTIAIAPGDGQYDAFWQWTCSTPETWAQDKLWLPVLARTVAVINTAGVAGNNTIIQPRNNPLDNSGLIKSWEAKNLSQDRISQARREATMGYERLKSPTTGQIYELPLETYDGTKGGYHNPERDSEILQRAPTGE